MVTWAALHRIAEGVAAIFGNHHPFFARVSVDRANGQAIRQPCDVACHAAFGMDSCHGDRQLPRQADHRMTGFMISDPHPLRLALNLIFGRPRITRQHPLSMLPRLIVPAASRLRSARVKLCRAERASFSACGAQR